MATTDKRDWEEKFETGMPPRGMHPSTGDFRDNGKSAIYPFGYKVFRNDEIFTVVDWGNIKSFIRSIEDAALLRGELREWDAWLSGARCANCGSEKEPHSTWSTCHDCD